MVQTLRKYIWYCPVKNELFTSDVKPMSKNKRHVVFIELMGHKVYLTKSAFYICKL